MPKTVVTTDRLMRPIAHFSHGVRVGDGRADLIVGTDYVGGGAGMARVFSGARSAVSRSACAVP